MMTSACPGLMAPIYVEDMLDHAAGIVDKFLLDDSSQLDLSERLRVPSHTQPSVSGTHDFDYPNLRDVGVGLDRLPEITAEKYQPLPSELIEQFGRMQCKCMMGLFAEIQRAFLTIDSDIFVWKYEDGTDLAYFDGLRETIVGVAIVRPKAGIFQPHIKYLLCIATMVEIVLLGVSFSRTFEGGGQGDDACVEEMHLLPEPLYSIPSDNTLIVTIVATSSGRIFMGGKDGALYELLYQAENGWFTNRCRKVCHSSSSLSILVPSFFNFSKDDPLLQISIDESRNVLYGRTENGGIQVFDLGRDGKGASRVTSLSHHGIVHAASRIARTVEKSFFKCVIHIAALTSSESANLHLLGITETGVRLYFAVCPFNSTFTGPSTLTLVHVRLPPGFCTRSSPLPSNIHAAYYRQGALLLASCLNEDRDILWVVSGDSFPFQKQLVESQVELPLDGKMWAVTELLPSETPTTRKPEPPSVVSQHVEPMRRFVLLTAQGCVLLRKLRPLEQLQSLMVNGGGPDCAEVKAFFRFHRLDQACATSLVLACCRARGDSQVSNWARMAFFMYGGEAQYSLAPGSAGLRNPAVGGSFASPVTGGASSLSSSVVYSPSTGVQSVGYAAPLSAMSPTHMSTPVTHNTYLHQPAVSPAMGAIREVFYSGKHNGIYIYLARILRPLWDTAVTVALECQTHQGPAVYLTSNLRREELSVVLELIRDLSDFVDFGAKFDSEVTPRLVSPVHVPARVRFGEATLNEHTRQRLQSEASRMEKISLQNVRELLHRVEEVVGLWCVLLNHQFHIITSALPLDMQSVLCSLTFKTLIITGKEVCTSLISCLVGRYLDDNATVHAIISRLREVCPSLYSTDDATCSRADELLHFAQAAKDHAERENHLQESLRLLKSVSTPLKLGVVCDRLVKNKHFTGVLELCLAEARKCDSLDLALPFFSHGEHQEDTQGMQAYLGRMECYQHIVEMLAFLCDTAGGHGVTEKVTDPAVCRPFYVGSGCLTAEEAVQNKKLVLNQALTSDDVLFHTTLYDWLFASQWSDLLLEVSTAHIEQYLQRRARQPDDQLTALDMLWKHYEKSGNLIAAARILSQLSQRHSSDMRLAQRVEYLSRAIMCAKSATSIGGNVSSGEFLHELEEMMEVARLQLQVLASVQRLADDRIGRGADAAVQELVARLHADLVDITTLYEDFADRCDLWDCKLAIVYCAGLHDQSLIEDLWENIINKEMSSWLKGGGNVSAVGERLVVLMKNYSTSERYFPLDFIIRHLEERSCKLDLSCKWVFLCMLDVDVQPERLVHAYDRLFRSRDPVWQVSGRPHHLLQVLHQLLSHLANSPCHVPVSNRRRFGMLCLDTVSSYLVELQAKAVDSTVHKLIGSFKDLQARLESFH